ncbi:MAG TPA: DUF6538 domain-containing protein [Achromobacter sp.]|uniref:DUF6538 domain-containing protein n=1 Tax=Achromobacter sp. TaxID=134375 RepID=UPI002F940E41
MSKLPPGLKMRGGVWHLRIGIPDNIRDTYPVSRNGKPATDAFRGSLGTSDRALALVLAHSKIAEVRKEFADRLALKQAKIAPPLVPLTPDLIAFVNASVARQVLVTDDVLRTEPHAAEAFLAPLRFLSQIDPAADFLDSIQAGALRSVQSHTNLAYADLRGLDDWENLARWHACGTGEADDRAALALYNNTLGRMSEEDARNFAESWWQRLGAIRSSGVSDFEAAALMRLELAAVYSGGQP